MRLKDTLPGLALFQVAVIRDTLRHMTPTTRDDADRLNEIVRQLEILSEQALLAAKEDALAAA